MLCKLMQMSFYELVVFQLLGTVLQDEAHVVGTDLVGLFEGWRH